MNTIKTIVAVILTMFATATFAFEPLLDAEMGQVSGGDLTVDLPTLGIDNIALEIAEYGEQNNLEDLLRDSIDTFADATGISFTFVIEGVQYAESQMSTFDPMTQSLSLKGPESIRLIELRDLRASNTSPIMGSMSFHGIQFETMNLKITPRL